MKDFLQLQGRILVADDEKVNVDFFKVMLSKIGFDVEVAYDGREVLEKVESFSPDLLLLDLLMPKLSGFQVAEILKKNDKTKDIPIVVLSAVNDVKEKVDLLGIGIDDYITKPFNFIEIIARIRNILKAKMLKGEIALARRDSRLLGELDAALKLFIAAAPAQVEEILGFLQSLKMKMPSDREDCKELLSRASTEAKQLFDGLKRLEESHSRFLASYSEELLETSDG